MQLGSRSNWTEAPKDVIGERDEARDTELARMGIAVFQIENEDLMTKNE